MGDSTSGNSQFLKTDGGKTKSNAIDVPSISLPKGGGAIKGIDEKFSVNAVNGTASFSIPLPFSPARGASPSLSLSYNSGAGNSIFGLGWNISLPSIKRKTDKGLPQYFDSIDSDTFLFSEAEDLVPEFKKETDGSFSIDGNGDYVINEKTAADGLHSIRFYRPRIEGLFARIERWTEKLTGIIKWRIITRDNVTSLFGWTNNAVVANPADNKKIFEWLPEFVFDDKGNCCQYIYKSEDEIGFDKSLLHHKNRFQNGRLTYTNIYPDKILYGNKTPYKKIEDDFPGTADYLFETVFDYGTLQTGDAVDTFKYWDFRTDAFSDYKAGFEIRTTRLCKRVLLLHHFNGTGEYDGLVRSVNLEYDTATQKDFTFLKSVTSFGYIKKEDGTYSSKNFPAVEFQYQKHEWNSEVNTIAAEELIHAPSGLDGAGYQFTDLFNEGLSGMLTEQANGWYYKHNLGGGKFERAKLVTPKPTFAGLGSQLQWADLNADGGKQLVNFANEPKGYFELDEDNEWQPFQYFKNLPNINLGDSNTRMLDLNGDGKPDILISEDHVFSWYPSSGKNGYETVQKTVKPFDEEKGPHVVFADLKQTVFLADMSAGGMTDIVRIRNGEVCYWPNLGYGKFGAKVAMNNAPIFDHPDTFNPSYIRLADIDGSGTTDIIYLGKNKFTCWMNLSGNSFSGEVFEINSFPAIDSEAMVTVADLLGNGVACIVWSSALQKDATASIKYIDLMKSKKPHIMVSYKNNLGKETYFEYTASTKFYIEDKLAGKPWVTKLHFPVHCISKTTTEDKISGYKFVSEYKYHHGYFDHAEKEFRGFGMVEQIDAEIFEHWQKSGATNITDATLHQEPVVSKTWNHTGAFLHKDKILNQFAKDYWYEEMQRQGFVVTHHEVALPDARLVAASGIDPTIISHLSAQEWREALRACKGMGLRSEVFARDAIKFGNTDEARKKELTPYTVSTHNCLIELLQPKGKNKFAVFTVKESEAISYSYERNTEDPRIAHSLNIKLDEYGNVLESAAIVYPRLIADVSMPEAVQQEQAKTIISYTQNEFTNDVVNEEAYRLRLPAATKTFELKGVGKTGSFYSMNDFENILDLANEVPYQQVNTEPTDGIPQKRLIEQVRINYRNNDLVNILPLHQLQSLAMPYESFQLAFTPELLTDIYGDKVNDGLLTESKFIHSEGDNNWWIRSGTTQFIQDTETAADAQNRFYLPLSYTDPFGSTTKVRYYSNYFLFAEQTEDALENKVTVDVFNFRTLSPQRMRDANNNISETIADELGLVKAMAVFGKGDQADDLDGLTEFTEQTEKDLIQEFFNVPELGNGIDDSVTLHQKAKQLLQHASARFVYDFEVYQNTGKPAVVSSIVRETHFRKDEAALNPESKLQLGFEYSNGLGQVLMKKVQAEPGVAKKVTIQPDDIVTVENVDTSTSNPVQLRWVGNGRTILNNKGNPVKQYEPYFSVTNGYEDVKELVETGVTPIMYYDAAGRLIKTEMPDNTFSKVEFDSWKQLTYDANDTVMESKWYTDRINNLIDDVLKDSVKEKDAAQKAALHFNTPATIHLDTFGRPCSTIAHNKRKDFGSNTIIEEFYTSLAVLDMESNLRKVIDAAGNTVMAYKYDMLGNMLYQNSMDAGEKWMLNDCMGKPVYAWDAKGHEFATTYDELHRPLTSLLINEGNTIITGRQEYIDTKDLNPAELLAQQNLNFIGSSPVQYDSAGITRVRKLDFKGNPLESSRQLCKDYKTIPDWTTIAVIEMEDEIFISSGEFDALNRPLQIRTPHTEVIPASVMLPVYNEAGVLDGMNAHLRGNVDATVFVTNIYYDAKGQRETIYYGNNSLTRYTYDNKTFRLLRLLTTSNNGTNILQDLRYTYDPVGNISFIKDNAQPTVFYNGQEIKPENNYEYDAIYQLVYASGREHIGQNKVNENNRDNNRNFPFQLETSPTNVNALRKYTQQYLYDAVGNILKMQHRAKDGDYTRKYWYNNNDAHRNELSIDATTIKNNQLLQTQIADTTTRYTHDIQGNMLNLPHLMGMVWNYKDQLEQIDLGGGGKAFYVYDGGGQRIRKVIEKNGLKEERLYLGAVEVFRIKNSAGDTVKQTDTLHLMDDKSRIAMVETPVITDDFEEQQVIRFIYGNHLGSSSLELNENAVTISYEEYHPYGTTSFSATNSDIKAAAKRYRYTGMERDEESGMAYHIARYYLNWLGRWLSADPIGIGGGLNSFRYVQNRVLISCDTSGTEDESVIVHDDEIGQTYSIDRPRQSRASVDPEPRYNSSETYEGYSIEPEEASAPVASVFRRKSKASDQTATDQFKSSDISVSTDLGLKSTLNNLTQSDLEVTQNQNISIAGRDGWRSGFRFRIRPEWRSLIYDSKKPGEYFKSEKKTGMELELFNYRRSIIDQSIIDTDHFDLRFQALSVSFTSGLKISPDAIDLGASVGFTAASLQSSIGVENLKLSGSFETGLKGSFATDFSAKKGIKLKFQLVVGVGGSVNVEVNPVGIVGDGYKAASTITDYYVEEHLTDIEKRMFEGMNPEKSYNNTFKNEDDPNYSPYSWKQ
ncbi:insecticidal toxin complex protein [Panacibacter sp. KCS-6]|uniref:Insecticidal toxin complex protein n=2 Tax=Limnovirga soli TaxID=2656915 RepID=A0A8J8FKM6_9BACT|nr:insecticidal toxin complex protein [Limnovirga soli]